MKAITIYQPWATLLADRVKSIETRTHGKFAFLKGERIAIHAAKFRLSHDEFARIHYSIRQRWDVEIQYCMSEAFAPHGFIIASAVVEQVTPPSSIFSTQARIDCDRAALCDTRGAWLYHLADVRKLKGPIECKGHQGVWGLPWNIEKELWEPA